LNKWAFNLISEMKKRFGFMKGNLSVLTIRQVLGMFFRKMVLSYASLYVIALGGESSQIGIINSVRPLAGLLMFPIAGYLTDRTSRVKIIAIADLFTGVTMLLYVLAPSWQWIAFGAFIQGFMVISFPPVSAIMADSIEPHNRGVGVAMMMTISSLISMFSPYIAAIVLVMYGDNMGMRILYGFLGLQALVSSVLVYYKLKETTVPEPLNKMPGVFEIIKNTYSGVPGLLKELSTSVKAVSMVVLLAFLSNGISSPFWVIYVTKIIGLTTIQWGTILLYESVLRVILTMPAGILSDRIGRTKTLLISIGFSLISIPMLIFANSFTTVLLIRLGAAVAGAMFIPSSSALISDYTPRNMRGKVMAAVGRGTAMIGAAGGGTGGPGLGYLFVIPVMISSLVGGILYDMNPTYPWYFVAGATVLQLLCVLLYIRDPEVAEN
jgi:DHA1 family tetracycline resistance protein-like MFS transporter